MSIINKSSLGYQLDSKKAIDLQYESVITLFNSCNDFTNTSQNFNLKFKEDFLNTSLLIYIYF